MKKELKDKWVAALRSGKYRQGEGQLRACQELCDITWQEYCCLGVLCDIQGMTEWKRIVPSVFDDTSHEVDLFFPPEPYMGGLTSKQVETLAELNDDKKKSFDEIADYIEENL